MREYLSGFHKNHSIGDITVSRMYRLHGMRGSLPSKGLPFVSGSKEKVDPDLHCTDSNTGASRPVFCDSDADRALAHGHASRCYEVPIPICWNICTPLINIQLRLTNDWRQGSCGEVWRDRDQRFIRKWARNSSFRLALFAYSISIAAKHYRQPSTALTA